MFFQCVDELAAITDIFRATGVGIVEDFAPMDFRGHPMIATGNNYFTPKSLIPYETFKRFSIEEDPFNVLNSYAARSKEDLVRIGDNEIGLYAKEMTYDKEGIM